MGQIILSIIFEKFDGKHYFLFYFSEILGFMMGRDGNGHFLENRKKTPDTG